MDQHTEFTSPPGLVLPRVLYAPLSLLTKTVSPSVEKGSEGLADVEPDHQSNPENEPPNPTLPIREKSTCGRVDGAGVDAMLVERDTRRGRSKGM